MAGTPVSSRSPVSPVVIQGGPGQGDPDFATMLSVRNKDGTEVFTLDSSGYAAFTFGDPAASVYIVAEAVPTLSAFVVYHGGNEQFAIDPKGHAILVQSPIITEINETPDADLQQNQVSLYFDSTNGVGNTKLMVKGKSADGTVKTASIILA